MARQWFSLLHPSQPEAQTLEHRLGGGRIGSMLAHHQPLKMPWTTHSSSKSSPACCPSAEPFRQQKCRDYHLLNSPSRERSIRREHIGDGWNTERRYLYPPKSCCCPPRMKACICHKSLRYGRRALFSRVFSWRFDTWTGDIFTAIETGGCFCLPNKNDRKPTNITTFIAETQMNWPLIMKARADN